MEYRREIDGLRALAVLPVIFFHAGFATFSGGFVGVDIFFVISGYLITTILIAEIDQNRFSILNFYERRARRILPALYFTIFLVSFFSTIIMLPSQLKDYGQSVVATVMFISNIYFFFKIDYWSQSSELLPLLHTWSLGVEEQYYILFPIFLLLAWPLGKNRVFLLIIFIAVLSLVLSEWGWRSDPTANFYLAPTRAWELLVGSIAAFIVQKQGVQRQEALSFIGLSAIVLAIFCYDKNTPFPSVFAILPVGGTFLLILYSEKETLVAKILSNKIMLSVGLISYSAYLWHQPILALLRVYKSNTDLSLYLKTFAIILTFIMAYFSYTFVEQPFRRKNGISRKSVVLFSIFPLIIFIVFGIFLHLSDGIRDLKLSTLSPRVQIYMKNLENQEIQRKILWKQTLEQSKTSFPNDGKYRVLFLGDSLSEDLFVVSTQSKAISKFASVRQMALDDECAKNIVTRGLELNTDGAFCSDALERLNESDLLLHSNVLVVANSWLSNAKFLEALLDLPVVKNKAVIIYKTHSFSTMSSLIMSLDGQDYSFTGSEYKTFVHLNKHGRTMIANAELESISRSRNIPTLNGFDAFCVEKLKMCDLFNSAGEPYIIDQTHLSVAGSHFFERWLADSLPVALQHSKFKD